MSNISVDTFNSDTGRIESISLDRLSRVLQSLDIEEPTISNVSEGKLLTTVSSFQVSPGVSIIDDAKVTTSTVSLYLQPSFVTDGTAIVCITASNKKINIFNATGTTITYFANISSVDPHNTQGYIGQKHGISPIDSIIVSMPSVQMNGVVIKATSSPTSSGDGILMYIDIQITPMAAPAYNPTNIVSADTITNSGYVNITNTYHGYPIIINNTKLNNISTISLDKSIVNAHPTHLNVTIKAGLQPVLVNNNTTYPISYSFTVLDGGITSLYEGSVSSGEYIPGMTQDRFIEGEYIDIYIQPLYTTQIDNTAPMRISGVQITGQVVILDTVTISDVIPPTIRTSPNIDFFVDGTANITSSNVNGSGGKLILDVKEDALISSGIRLTSSISSLAAYNNIGPGTTLVVKYYNSDIIPRTAFDTYGSGSTTIFYQKMYGLISVSPPTSAATDSYQQSSTMTGVLSAETFIGLVLYPSNYNGTSNHPILAIFSSSSPNLPAYVNDNQVSVQGFIEVETSVGHLNNFGNTQLLELIATAVVNGASSADYGFYIDPSIVNSVQSQSNTIDGFCGIFDVVSAKTLNIVNTSPLPVIVLYEQVSGTTTHPNATSSGYKYMGPAPTTVPVGTTKTTYNSNNTVVSGSNGTVTYPSIQIIPPSGSSSQTFFTYSVINAHNNFLVIYASVANGQNYDSSNIIAQQHGTIDNDSSDISTTILTPLSFTAPIVTLTPANIVEDTNPLLIYTNALNSALALENQTGKTLSITNNGVTTTLANGANIPYTILFGIQSFSISGSSVVFNTVGTAILNQTLFLTNGVFAPTLSQLGGYLQLQYGGNKSGVFIIPSGITNYTPILINNISSNILILENGTSSTLSLDLAIYSVSNKGILTATIAAGSTYELGNPSALYMYTYGRILKGIIIN